MKYAVFSNKELNVCVEETTAQKSTSFNSPYLETLGQTLGA